MNYCQLHSLQFTQVCLQSDCNRKGPLCEMCVGSHDQHMVRDLKIYLQEQHKQLQGDIQGQILNKLESMKHYFHDFISKLQIDINMLDEKRKLTLVTSLLNEKMNTILFQSKLTELIQRDQINDYQYLSKYNQILQNIDESIRNLFNTLPKRTIESQSMQISPQLSNRSREPIFKSKDLSASPLRKLQQRDLSPVGAFHSRIKNYFTEIESQQSTNRQDRYEPAFKLTKPFEIEPMKLMNPMNDSYRSAAVENQHKQYDVSPTSSKQHKYFNNSMKPYASNNQQNDIINKSFGNNNNTSVEQPHTPQSYFGNANKSINNTSDLNKSHTETIKNIKMQLNESFKKSIQSNASFVQQNLDISNISSRSAAPPPVRKTMNLPNPFHVVVKSTWRAHEKSIKDIITMDNDKLISCSRDKTIKVWHKPSQQVKIILKGHLDIVHQVAFSKRRILASASSDRTVRIWKPQPHWQEVQILTEHTDRVRCVVFIEDYIVSGSDDTTIKIWELDGKLVQSYKTPGRVSAIVVCNSTLVIGAGKSILQYEVTTLQAGLEVPAHNNLVQCLTLQTNIRGEGLLISGGKDNYIKLWQYPEMSLLREIQEDYIVKSIALDPTSQFLAVGLIGHEGEGKISLWKMDSEVMRVQEICDNAFGCNKLFFDEGMLYSCHENKRIQVVQIS